MSRVGALADDTERSLSAETELLLLLNNLRQFEAGSLHFKKSDLWLKKLQEIDKKCPRRYIEYLLAKTESLLLANRVGCSAGVIFAARRSDSY